MQRHRWPDDDGLHWTPRQREVLDLIAAGHTNGRIAERLGITLAGAKWHVGEILSKLEVRSRDEAADYWREQRGLGRRVKRAVRSVVVLFGSKAAMGSVAAFGVAALGFGAVLIASGGGDPESAGPGETVNATASPTASPSATQVAIPTTVPPANLDPQVARLVESAAVPLELVTWVEETVEDNGYAFTLHGIYADVTRTVAFATARPIDPNAEGVLPWVNISYAHLTDAAGNAHEMGGPRFGTVASTLARTGMRFEPLSDRAEAGMEMTLRFNELAGPHSQYIYGNWSFEVDVPVREPEITRPMPPAAVVSGGVTYTVTSIVITGWMVEATWEVEGISPRSLEVPAVSANHFALRARLQRSDGSPSGWSTGGGDGNPPDPDGPLRFTSTFMTKGPGDYVLILGDPETSTASFSLTIP